MAEKLFFYGWWVLADGLIHYLTLDFLMDVTGIQRKNRYLPLWLAGNGVLIIGTVSFRLPGMFFFDILFLVLFAKAILHIKWKDLAAPATIIVTFYTFLEGFSAVTMSWVSRNMNSAVYGRAMQMVISVCLDGICFAGLWFIRKKYLFTLRQSISSCLYILLLPCVLVVLSIRYGLRLDSPVFEEYLSAFGIDAGFLVFFMMAGAVVLFFLILEIFCKIITMTEYEKSSLLLKSQVKAQRIYLEEAKKRNEKYSSFQHDIDNHLLVLSGLVREKRYDEAGEYAKKLYENSRSLTASISTGNVVVDLLLKEKLDFAKRNDIKITCTVRLPDTFDVDDMDLCVIFANLMDNAVDACMKTTAKERFLSISTKVRSRFLVIEAVNSASDCGPVKKGTGLHNVETIAEKYHGTMEIESGSVFRVSVLLCFPQE